jgi:iron complex outermembrane recepter protein
MRRFAAAASLCAPLLAVAAAPATPVAPKQDAPPVVELSPFVVDAQQDTGYVANDTLSGTRTRTSLKDVPSAVSVFTADLLADLAAIGEKDVLLYSASAVAELGDQNANVSGNNLGQPGFQHRIRGQPASRARNYFVSLVPPDTYNLERFEESRGPNAILFGMGGAGGLLNQTTKRANLARSQTTLTGTFGSDNLRRGEVDHNQVIAPRKFAVRVNGMAVDGDSWRPFEFSHERRGDVAAALQISPRIKFTAEHEKGFIHDSVSRQFGAADNFTLWNDQGRPTSASRTANAAQGIALGANQQRVTVIGNDGSVHNFQQMPQTTTDVSRRGAAITDERIIPRAAYLEGPGSERFIDFHSETAFLELQPAKDLFVELAADYQHSEYSKYDPLIRSYQIFGEPSTVYREGTANPYAGKLYVDATWRLVKQRDNQRTLRGTASYAFNLGRWGRHNISGMGQQTRNRYFRDSLWAVLLDRPFNAAPYNARNQIATRHYITNPADAAQYSLASWRQIPAQLTVAMDAGAAPQTFRTGWVTNASGKNDDWTVIRSYVASTQSYFFHDRLVASLGFRRDERFSYTRASVMDPATGAFVIDRGAVTLTPDAANESSVGLVFHATPWLSLIYNQSQNAGDAGTRGTLIPDGSLQPISRGKGRDAGITLSLLQRRVFLRLAYYETSMIDDGKSSAANGNTIDRNDRIVDTMIADRIVTTAEAQALRYPGAMDIDLYDRRSTGWELNLTANPTAKWRMLLNGSQGKSVETNMLKRTRSIMDALLATWARARQTSTTTGGTTVAQEIADFHSWFNGTTAVEGKSSLGDREWQLKFFNRYQFDEGVLKGFYVGGGWRYQSAPTIGVNTTTGVFYRGESVTEVDALVGYQTRWSWLGRNTRVSLQLNGSDLLHRRDYFSVRRDPNGLLSTIRIVDPASYKLQAKLTF